MNRLPETNGNVVTSWIPLETAWPGNPDCANLQWNYHDTIIAGYDPGYGVTASDVTCHPKAVTTWWLQERLGPNTETVVSLGPITCPEDYYTVTQRAQDPSSTLIACCPSGYEYDGKIMSHGTTGQCASKVAEGDVLSYITRGQDGSWATQTSTATAATSVVGVQINGWKFAEETAAAATPSSGSGSGSGTWVANSQTASAEASSQVSETLGTSAKIGIGVGVSLGATGLVALGAGLLMMYRARKAARSMSHTPLVEKDLSGGGCGGGGEGSSRSVSSSQSSSRQYAPEVVVVQDANPRVETPHYPAEQNWGGGGVGSGGYSTEQPAYSAAYGVVTLPHGEMEGTTPTPLSGVANEGIQRRMELEGEFERNIKVLRYPHR